MYIYIYTRFPICNKDERNGKYKQEWIPVFIKRILEMSGVELLLLNILLVIYNANSPKRVWESEIKIFLLILGPAVSPIFIIRKVLPHQFLDRVSPIKYSDDAIRKVKATLKKSSPNLGFQAEKFSNLSFSITKQGYIRM